MSTNFEISGHLETRATASWPESSFLDLGAGEFLSANPRRLGPQDAGERGQISCRTGWRSMSRPVISTGPTWANPKANDGSIFRSDLDGRNMTNDHCAG